MRKWRTPAAEAAATSALVPCAQRRCDGAHSRPARVPLASQSLQNRPYWIVIYTGSSHAIHAIKATWKLYQNSFFMF